MRSAIVAAALLALSGCMGGYFAWDHAPLVLSGEITHADHQTYREIPFDVPHGTRSVLISFSYDKENRTVIDIGVRDPGGLRGWSGGNKAYLVIGESASTPSYSAGPIAPGEWKLILGIPNIRDGVTASYFATVVFSNVDDPAAQTQSVASVVLSTKPGWRRGDFHTHTAHSDGSCDVDLARSPCPVFNTADAARDASLDFVAITDHNTITQFADIRGRQPAYPKTLLIPGTEVTTFFGHANVIGNSDFVDFQLGSPRLPTLSRLFDEAAAQGAIVSVNHPGLPSGEICMGCGWTVKDTDWSRVTAIEVINGSTLRSSGSDVGGIAFWEKLLREGHRITAIGGSDNHDATDRTGAKQSPIGKPATVVFADELSTRGIVAGVKSGRVFVDAAGLPGAVLDMQARVGARSSWMGEEMHLSASEEAGITVTTMNIPDDARMEIIGDGLDTDTGAMALGPAPSFKVKLAAGAVRGWVRVNIRSVDGKLLLLGNPIYFARATTS